MRYLSGFWHLVYVDTIIMLLLSITSAGKNILYTLYLTHDYHLLAPLSYVCNYLFGPLTLLCVDWLIQKYSFKTLFYVSSFNLNIFLIGGMMVSSCENNCSRILIQITTILTSLLAGILQTVFYVSFVTYINYLSNHLNKELFYGISFSFTSMSNILANIIGYYLSQNVSWFYFYLIILITSAVLQFAFFFAKDDRQLVDQSQTLLKELKYQAKSLYSTLADPNYKRFLGVLLFAGLMNSVIYLFIPILIQKNGYPEDDITNQVFIGLLITGVGQVIGGISSGKMSELFTENEVLYSMFFINIIAIVLVQYGNLSQNYLILIGCFLLGITDSAISSLALIVITKQISTTNHAFAGYNLCQSLGFGIASLWWGGFNEKGMIYDIIFLYVTSILATSSFFYYQLKNETKNKKVLETSIQN